MNAGAFISFLVKSGFSSETPNPPSSAGIFISPPHVLPQNLYILRILFFSQRAPSHPCIHVSLIPNKNDFSIDLQPFHRPSMSPFPSRITQTQLLICDSRYGSFAPGAGGPSTNGYAGQSCERAYEQMLKNSDIPGQRVMMILLSYSRPRQMTTLTYLSTLYMYIQ